MTGRLEIRRAVTDADLRAIHRFRYSVYVEEMNRPQKHANAADRTIIDPLDGVSHNIAAWIDGQVVACIRLTWPDSARCDYMDYYNRLYRMEHFGTLHPTRTSIVTRLMIAAEQRRTNVASQLFAHCYVVGLEHGTVINVMDCNAHLVTFFRKIGYREYMGDARHEEYGDVTPMYLDLLDMAYLRTLRSPYVRVYETWLAGQPLGQPYHA